MVDRVISATIGALLIVLGLRSLFKTPDPDASLPRWMESVSSITPAKVFGIGMVLFPLQIRILAIFLACINLIATASLRTQDSIVALALALLIFAVPVLGLIGLYAAMPQRAPNMLGSLGMDGEEQPHDYGRALLRVRSVLPSERLLGTVGLRRVG